LTRSADDLQSRLEPVMADLDLDTLYRLDVLGDLRTHAAGPAGSLPLTHDLLLNAPSGDLFAMTQNAAMGWTPAELGRDQVLILSTAGGIRRQDGTPLALGYHTGHWEVALLVQAAAEELRAADVIPFAGAVTDPCDGRSQGTTGMFDSLPYRNDAAVVLRRLIRSLPTRKGVIGIATCDKGAPAMLMALAGCRDQPAVFVPGGVTLPPTVGEDAGTIQSIGARYAHGAISLKDAAELGCRACATPGGGCQFLGTAATMQVIGEALGLALPHSALAPSGQAVWLELARASARALLHQRRAGLVARDILSADALHNAMATYAAVGGSTNALLHLPAIAHAAGLERPRRDDWLALMRRVPRLVDALPNGPSNHPTVRVYLAGGVPEVMLHLRALGLLRLDARTASGRRLGDVLAWWEGSERRRAVRARLAADGIDPDDVIMAPQRARDRGMTGTIAFLSGNCCPQGAVIKATSIDPSVVDADHVYRKTGPARVFVREKDAVAAIKGLGPAPVQAGDIVVLCCGGPLGTGMEEIYQVTSALKHIPWGKQVAVITDARFSGVSTGACIGHVGPEALAGGPIGKLRDGDRIRIVVDRDAQEGTVDLIGDATGDRDAAWGSAELLRRSPREDLAPHPALPADTRLWAVLQQLGGGTWGGCVYDPEAVVAALAQVPGVAVG
jgi:putative YjhG/YagF family dehydratase